MSRRPLAFRQSDVMRAVKAVRAAGMTVARIEVDNGKIVVVVGEPGKVESQTPLDQWMADRARTA